MRAQEHEARLSVLLSAQEQLEALLTGGSRAIAPASAGASCVFFLLRARCLPISRARFAPHTVGPQLAMHTRTLTDLPLSYPRPRSRVVHRPRAAVDACV